MDEVQLGGEERGGERHGDRAPTAADRARTQAKAAILLAEGNSHAAAGRFDDAMASMASALAIDPSNLDILDALDECRALQRETERPRETETPRVADTQTRAEAEPTPRAAGGEQAARWEQEGYSGKTGAATETTPAPSPRSEPPLFMREGADSAYRGHWMGGCAWEEDGHVR
jgi:hypothetical protein